MSSTRRIAGLVTSVLALQFTLLGATVPCDEPSVAAAVDMGGMAGLPMGDHAMPPASDAPPANEGCAGGTPSTDCTPSGNGVVCQAMTACAPVVSATVIQLVAVAPLHPPVPGGHLLTALSRAAGPEPPPPRT
jgi:hypothetical protein